jgi:O-acetyl-ADP-ribose deacetylase (regulator of RNase III)
MQLGGVTSEAMLRRATRNALKRAVENKLKSIAFPAIGTGIAGFPMRRCAEVMLDEIRNHVKSRTSLDKVEMVLFDKSALAEFERVFAALPD